MNIEQLKKSFDIKYHKELDLFVLLCHAYLKRLAKQDRLKFNQYESFYRSEIKFKINDFFKLEDVDEMLNRAYGKIIEPEKRRPGRPRKDQG